MTREEFVDVGSLASELRRRAESGARVLLGIAGAPGAGKSTLVARLLAELSGAAACAPMDGFHLAASVIAVDERRSRRGAPDTFDPAGYAALLARLRDNSDDIVYAPEYRREIEDPVACAIPIPRSCRIVLTEGNYLLHPDPAWRRARSYLDEVWFLQAPDEELRVRRLIARHEQFGKPPEVARTHVLGSDERNAALVAGHRDEADRILRWPAWEVLS